jgi:AraC-like DNA-binding protein
MNIDIRLEKAEYTSLQKEKCTLLLRQNVKAVQQHEHGFLELSYILRGNAEHTLDGNTEILSSGDYLIVDYGSRHSYRACGNGDFDNYDCLFLPELLDPALQGTKSLRAVLEHYLLHFNMNAIVKNPARAVFHDEDGSVRTLIEKIHAELQKKEAGFTELARCYLVEILLLTMRKIDGVQSATYSEITVFLTAYVEKHYAEQISLSALAAQMNYSLPYVSQRFKSDTGVTFMHYLQNYRITRACRMLASSRMSFAQITEAVGYFDAKCFAQLIKRNTGLSPSAFRRKHRDNTQAP